MRTLAFLALLIPSIALAQPAPDPAAPPPPPPGPPAPAPAPAPAPPPGPPGPPPAGYAPQPYYAPQPQPYAQPQYAYARDAWSYHRGVTGEVGLGLGWMRASSDNGSDNSDAAPEIVAGIGGFINPHLALSARLNLMTISQNNLRTTNSWIGLDAQYWATDMVWVGGGMGFAQLSQSFDSDSASVNGWGLDLRFGVAVVRSQQHVLNIGVELSPCFYTENGASATFTNIAVQAAYQFL